MHFVGFALQPIEEATHAVPAFVSVFFPRAPGRVAVDDVALVVGTDVAKRHIHRNVARRHVLLQIVLTLLKTRGLPRLDRAFGERLGLVGNDQTKVDTNHTAKTTTGVARAERIVERER